MPIHLCTLDIAEGSVPSQWPLAAILSPEDINSVQNSHPASPSHDADQEMRDKDSVQNSHPASPSHDSDQEMRDKDTQDSDAGIYQKYHLFNSQRLTLRLLETMRQNDPTTSKDTQLERLRRNNTNYGPNIHTESQTHKSLVSVKTKRKNTRAPSTVKQRGNSHVIDSTDILNNRHYVPYTVGKTYVKLENIDLDQLQASLIS
jgi:hypothetical protein